MKRRQRTLFDGEPFTCLDCGFVSYNPNDAKHRYCARCHRFMDDLRSDADARYAARRFQESYQTLLPKKGTRQ